MKVKVGALAGVVAAITVAYLTADQLKPTDKLSLVCCAIALPFLVARWFILEFREALIVAVKRVAPLSQCCYIIADTFGSAAVILVFFHFSTGIGVLFLAASVGAVSMTLFALNQCTRAYELLKGTKALETARRDSLQDF